MGEGWTDGRRWATVFGAVFQVVAGFFVPVGELAVRTPSLVLPAGYAFAIWGPIFALCLLYAVYGALPSRRGDPVLGRVGWPLAGAFVLDGVWEVSVLFGRPVLLQAILAGVFLCAAVAFLRLVRSDARALGAADRWLVAPTVGLLFGWITAANVVGLNDTLVELGLVGTGLAAALLGGGLLVSGGLVASAVVTAGEGGPAQARLSYAAAVVWGLVGVVANQYDASLITSGAALLAAALVVAALLGRPVWGRGS